MTSGYPSDATENAVQANIVSVGYQESSASCSTTNPIVPYISVAGTWSAAGESSVTVASGTAVDLGPQPVGGGSWSWSGPNGYTGSNRSEVDNIPVSTGVNTFTATYTTSYECTYQQTFTITVSGSSGGQSITTTLGKSNRVLFGLGSLDESAGYAADLQLQGVSSSVVQNPDIVDQYLVGFGSGLANVEQQWYLCGHCDGRCRCDRSCSAVDALSDGAERRR